MATIVEPPSRQAGRADPRALLRSDFGFEDFVSRFCYTLFDGLTPAAELQLTQVRSFVFFSFKVLCISA